jgi:hypothetical protein
MTIPPQQVLTAAAILAPLALMSLAGPAFPHDRKLGVGCVVLEK